MDGIVAWRVEIYADRRGREPVSEYVKRLARNGEHAPIATLWRYVDLLEQHGANIGFPIDRPLDSKIGLYELRPGDHRVAYGEAGGTIYLLNCWRKQANRAPQREVARATRTLEQLRG